MMTMRHAAAGLVGLGLVVGGCSVVGSLLGIAEVLLLGIVPDANFASAGTEGYGKARLSLGAEDEGGSPLAPVISLLDITSDDGSEVVIEDSTEHPGFQQGSFVLLVDGSGSMEYVGADCPYCPSDPARYRVQAAQQLAQELHGCAPEWRISLMEFTTSAGAGGLDETRVLTDFTQETAEIIDAAESLGSDGGTPIWDSASAVLSRLVEDADEYEQLALAEEDADTGGAGDTGAGDTGAAGEEDGGYGRGLVILSDGEDTESSSTLDALISQAQSAGIPVHVIGLGQASDLSEFSTSSAAVSDLQRLASETGGYYGAVYGAEDLPALAGNIAQAHCGGYSDLTVRWAEPPTSGEMVSGSVNVAGTTFGVPFSFRAP